MQQEPAMTFRLGENMPLRLGAREVLNIRDGAGLAVKCLEGALWITQDGDLADVVLGEGQSFVLDRPGLALVSALVPATAEVQTQNKRAPRPASKRSTTERFRRAA